METPMYVNAFNENTGAGVVYIFTKENNVWKKTGKITNSDTTAETNSGFGLAIALSSNDNKLFIGAAYYDGSGQQRGAVYVYARQNGSWNQIQKIDDTTSGITLHNYDEFGSAFGSFTGRKTHYISDHRVMRADSELTPVQSIYSGKTTTFGHMKALLKNTANNIFLEPHSRLGSAINVSADGNTLYVGARGHSRFNATGSVYIFTKENNNWTLEESINSSFNGITLNPKDHFAASLTLSRYENILAVWCSWGWCRQHKDRISISLSEA